MVVVMESDVMVVWLALVKEVHVVVGSRVL